jgi:hypothetical protein
VCFGHNLLDHPSILEIRNGVNKRTYRSALRSLDKLCASSGYFTSILSIYAREPVAKACGAKVCGVKDPGDVS